MKESFWGIFVIILGVVGLSFISVIQSITTTNENNYYLLKEVSQASMFDSLDLGEYRRTGKIKIIEEKFIENFLRRFSESYGRTGTFTVEIYDIIEEPPKVSLLVNEGQTLKVYDYNAVDFDIGNRIDAILETKY
ncbi:MAG TPA: hypothetical protein GXZ95_05175 [Mollicutes bacterium]|nr:hypothetical protein [Mollicutes bacterium]